MDGDADKLFQKGSQNSLRTANLWVYFGIARKAPTPSPTPHVSVRPGIHRTNRLRPRVSDTGFWPRTLASGAVTGDGDQAVAPATGVGGGPVWRASGSSSRSGTGASH